MTLLRLYSNQQRISVPHPQRFKLKLFCIQQCLNIVLLMKLLLKGQAWMVCDCLYLWILSSPATLLLVSGTWHPGTLSVASLVEFGWMRSPGRSSEGGGQWVGVFIPLVASLYWGSPSDPACFSSGSNNHFIVWLWPAGKCLSTVPCGFFTPWL